MKCHITQFKKNCLKQDCPGKKWRELTVRSPETGHMKVIANCEDSLIYDIAFLNSIATDAMSSNLQNIRNELGDKLLKIEEKISGLNNTLIEVEKIRVAQTENYNNMIGRAVNILQNKLSA